MTCWSSLRQVRHFSSSKSSKEQRQLSHAAPDLIKAENIFNHGDEWTQRLRRLEKLGHRPDRCLIALKPPHCEDLTRQNAFLDIRKEFAEIGVELAEETETGNFLQFARIPEVVDLRLSAG
jgi:hypothetical protein